MRDHIHQALPATASSAGTALMDRCPPNHAYKIIRKAAEYPAVDTFTVIDVASCDSLSHHESEAKARAAVRRYERADARRDKIS
jgi:hypothetical protein